MKYNLGDIVYYLNGNKIAGGIIVARQTTDYIPNINKYLSLESKSWLINSFKDSVPKYAVSLNNFSYIIIEEDNIFLSKEELIEYIQKEE